MKKFNAALIGLGALVLLSLSGAGTVLAAGSAPVSLGTAGNYVILAKTAINNNPISNITGEIITADKMNAYNDFGKAEEVNIKSFTGFKSNGKEIKMNLPAKSVVGISITTK